MWASPPRDPLPLGLHVEDPATCAAFVAEAGARRPEFLRCARATALHSLAAEALLRRFRADGTVHEPLVCDALCADERVPEAMRSALARVRDADDGDDDDDRSRRRRRRELDAIVSRALPRRRR